VTGHWHGRETAVPVLHQGVAGGGSRRSIGRSETQLGVTRPPGWRSAQFGGPDDEACDVRGALGAYAIELAKLLAQTVHGANDRGDPFWIIYGMTQWFASLNRRRTQSYVGRFAHR
jgi:hypothetical protein